MPTFSRNAFTTYYEDTGSGEPVVLICGLSADLQVWRLQVPELAKTHRVVAYDNRGAGRTDAPDEQYSIAQMADDLDQLLEHLDIAAAHVVGWSMGGVIAQSLARSNPRRVRQMLLLGTFAAPDGYLSAAISNWVNMRRSNMTFEQVIRHVARLVYSPALANKPKAYEAFVRMMLANPYKQSEHGFYRQADALLAYQPPSDLPALGVPTTILVGEDDQLTPPYMSEQLHAALPGSGLLVLPGAHSGFVERADKWTPAIQAILARATAQ